MPEKFYKEIDLKNVDYYLHHAHLDLIETEIHQHKKGQLLYAEGGIVHVFILDKHWYLPARCFMWIPANTPHSILTYSRRGDLYNIYFKEDNSSSFYNTTNIYYAGDLLREMLLHTKNWNGIIIKEEIAKYSFLQAIYTLLPSLEKNLLPITTQHPFPKDEKLIEIAKFLSNNLEKNYSLEEISKEFGLSSRTLSRKFKDSVGMSYVRFLRSLRVTKAMELIAINKYNMYEIAFMVGYQSLASFSTIFNKVFGMRPTDYAALLHKKH